MKKTSIETMDWALWFYWIMATTIGWMIGRIFFSVLQIIISGVAISALQGVVLHNRIDRAWRWAIFSSVGWITAYTIHFVIFSANLSILAGPIIGGVVGVIQWLLLRNEFDWAGWWIIISILAWTTGLTTIPGLLTSGALSGALTGITLVILFRYSPLKKQS